MNMETYVLTDIQIDTQTDIRSRMAEGLDRQKDRLTNIWTYIQKERLTYRHKNR